MKKFAHDFQVVGNTRLNTRHFILELKAAVPLPEILPGQFVQVLVHNSPSTFLRRPFSIHFVDYSTNTLRLLVQVKGEGTRHMGMLAPGDTLNLVYPLGNSFSVPATHKVLLVGGGAGVAPLMFMGDYLNKKNIRPDFLVGFRSADEVSQIDEYSKFGKVYLSTDDGSMGEKGFVTQHSVFKQSPLPYDRIYCCGPDAMMHAVSKLAAEKGVACEVSLENFMACGYGVCLCCITQTDKGNERVCIEGPVFDAARLKWQSNG
ncbi:MAG: dihydroorotate dehydrogenase electron transfer subunit [Bacteroidetes bacterium]|nr:dihydroorotate dehydrogenase electron transfer subunit [Bacteroidota bacterium]